MKKPLYYAIRTGSLYNPVIAVTSERGRYVGRTDRWFGRDTRDNMATHGRISDLSGRFDTLEAAVAKRSDIAKLSDTYDEARKALTRATSKLYATERAALTELLADKDPGKVPYPIITYDWR